MYAWNSSHRDPFGAANVELPWADIDFDFMNLNQAAHGDREFGYIQTRLGVSRKTVVGHVSNPEVTRQIEDWQRAAAGWQAARTLKLARFGDNMRYVAVTEGDKTEAELQFGVQVNTWGVNELAEAVADAGARWPARGCCPADDLEERLRRGRPLVDLLDPPVEVPRWR